MADATEATNGEAEEEVKVELKRGKVTIVGAGPIGTACGMTLAQKGKRGRGGREGVVRVRERG